MPEKVSYIGRFAPTPSGPLHFGSIVAALGSYLDAHHNLGKWLVRIDDIDTPRNMPGATDVILRTLETLGLHWDNEVLYQSRCLGAYEAAIEKLSKDKLLFPCTCPRKLVKGKPYPGTCRQVTRIPDKQHSLRIRTQNTSIRFLDLLQGECYLEFENRYGDFIVQRSDGIFAYHLTTIVDDANQQINHVVRGGDLIDSTPCQLFLQQQLGYKTPCYSHLPVAIDPHGNKLSKQHGARDALSENSPETLLLKALNFLGQKTTIELREMTVSEIINWAISHWDIAKIPHRAEILVQ